MFLYSIAELKGFSLALLAGIWNTLYISIIGTIVGLIIGLICGIIRVQSVNTYDNGFVKFAKRSSNFLVKGYVNIFRGTPMILQALILYNIFIYIFTLEFAIPIASLITVSINTGDYLTEVIRNGIQSIDKGQMEAARALGMSQQKAMINVIFPQALKNSFASIGNEFIINIKDTSVLQIIGLQDVFYVIKDQAFNDFRILFWYLVAGVVYLILTYGCSKILNITEKKIGAPVKEITSSN